MDSDSSVSVPSIYIPKLTTQQNKHMESPSYPQSWQTLLDTNTGGGSRPFKSEAYMISTTIGGRESAHLLLTN